MKKTLERLAIASKMALTLILLDHPNASTEKGTVLGELMDALAEAENAQRQEASK